MKWKKENLFRHHKLKFNLSLMKSASIFFTLLLNTVLCLGQEKRVISNELYTPTESETARNYYNSGHDYFVQENFKKAVEYYKMAILEDPNYIDAYDNLGLSFRNLNLLDSAQKYYLISHSKYPKGAVAITNLAVVQEYKNNTEGAIIYYKKAIEIEPENPEGYYGLSRMYLNSNKYEDALKYGLIAEKYYKLNNSPYIGDCYYLLCLIYYYNNNKPLAQKYLALSKKAGIDVNKNIEKDLK